MPRVLVVDDEEMVRSAMAMVFRIKGWTAQQAGDGSEGLARARETRPDVIVCDLNMPVMDGIEMLTELRRDAALVTVPVIVISGRLDPLSVESAKIAGATAFLAKPFDIRELVSVADAQIATRLVSPA
jgi:CheY-like chemotaxis protein